MSQLEQTLVSFIQTTFTEQAVKRAVIAVSGGIDSAVSTTLVSKALGVENATPVLLPYGDQNMDDAKVLLKHLQFDETAIKAIDIKPVVDLICTTRNIESSDKLRRGNVMARVRMIMVYDLARELSALVCGTENKSEHYLGYFTRFGDAASDIEPIESLYKTQVRELAVELGIPSQLIAKPPTAGLWDAQTDEQELGFTYEQADRVLALLVDQGQDPDAIAVDGIDPSIVKRITDRVKAQSFKRVVPYTMKS